jgi:tRNA A-37 threonylcarbamoyl transferase component Bud32
LFPRLDVPAGYERRDFGPATLIARPDVVEPLARVMNTERELIEFAAKVPGARPLQGRQTAYGITLDSGPRVVVRRNHHGGAFRKWTGSTFLFPTRAPTEMQISLELRRLGVSTPPVVAIAIYREGILASSDVVTEEIAGSQDFGAFLLASRPESEERRSGWTAVGTLLATLAASGARHHDLNVKNILLRRTSDKGIVAYALDVDRVNLGLDSRDADAGNRARLLRSIEKWRDTRQLQVNDAEIETLRRTAPSTR